MFVGHLAAALGAKQAAPRVSLGVLVAAAFGLDLLWPLLLLAGIERVRIDPGNTAFTPLDFEHYPWSHSLAMVLVWSAGAGLLMRLAWNSTRAGAVVGATVLSHWVLDFVTHRPDLPLWPGGPMVGLGVWQSIAATVLLEGGLFLLAVEAYRRAFRPRDGIGRWAFRALIALIALIWISGPWSPPPPSAQAIAVVGLAMWLFPPWAGVVDRHRTRQSP